MSKRIIGWDPEALENRDKWQARQWQPISPGDKAFEYPCPTCDADIHEFCTSRDKHQVKREHYTEVHWSRCEVADGKR